MNPVSKALWYIESHFREEVSLDDLADVSGVSRYYMSRAFTAVVGLPMQRYVRARRVTEAARTLVRDAPDILRVAVDSGYGSHEAFTRAFREQFGVTPESVRDRRSLTSLALVDPFRLEALMTHQLSPPRFEDRRALLIAGYSARYTQETRAGIPSQWQSFAPHLGHVPRQIGKDAYGVCYNTDDDGNMDYLCGVEVADFTGVPQEFARLRVGAQHYAIFAHRAHISGIGNTFQAIFADWVPRSGYQVVDAPVVEYYPETFDGRTGMGGLEVWLPVRIAS